VNDAIFSEWRTEGRKKGFGPGGANPVAEDGKRSMALASPHFLIVQHQAPA
jgi:hypothetical protein